MFILASIAFVSCARHIEDDINPMNKDIVFKASWEESSNSTSKTVLQEDGTSVWWSTGEKINVFYGNTRSGVFTSTNTSPAAEASFTGTLALKDGVTEDIPSANYWAVYPYNENNTCDGESVTLTIPANQTATEGTFADNFFPAVARSKNSTLSFYNVCGGIRFSVYNEGITSVSIKSIAEESLVGTVKVVFDENGKPSVSTVTAGGGEIIVTAPEGGFAPGKYYFAAILPQTLSSGIKLTFVNTTTKQASKSIDKAITVNRSRFGILDEKDKNLDFVPEGSVQFGDVYFKAFCVEYFDTDGDGEISKEEANAVKYIVIDCYEDPSADEIESFEGVEFFENLEYLSCTASHEYSPVDGSIIMHGRLKTVRIDKNPKLELLNLFYHAGLGSLKLSSRSLKRLSCGYNGLDELDVSACPALEWLDCSGVLRNNEWDNEINDWATGRQYTPFGTLKKLNISNCEQLSTLKCDSNGDNLTQIIGLEDCHNLTRFTAYYNDFRELDFSTNPKIERLYLSGNIHLKSLNISKCPDLDWMSLWDCRELTTVDFTNNTKLKELRYTHILNINLSSCAASLSFLQFSPPEANPQPLDLTGMTNLKTLNTWHFRSLDLSPCPNLVDMWLGSSNCTEGVDLSPLTKLESFRLEWCSFETLDISSNVSLTNLDLSTCGALKTLYVAPGQNIEGVTVNRSAEKIHPNIQIVIKDGFTDPVLRAYMLEHFDTDNDGAISDAEATAVEEISITSDDIQSLSGIERCINLKSLWVVGTKSDEGIGSGALVSLDVSACTQLKYLYVFNNKLKSLDVSSNTALTELWCEFNQLTSLDVSENTALTHLSCHHNQLSALDIAKNSSITFLNCSSNLISKLDFSNNAAIGSVYCQNNQLTTLDFSNNLDLKYLHCGGNLFTSLDINKNTALVHLDCCHSPLASLDISNNTALEVLQCYRNQLTVLDVSKNKDLSRLECYMNQLTSLDVSNNLSLNYLDCTKNPSLTDLWLKTGQSIAELNYDSNVTTLKYL